MFTKLLQKAGKAVGNKVASKVKDGAVSRGVNAFRSYQANKPKASALPKPSSGIPTRVGEFATGIEPNLKPRKESAFGRGSLFKTGF